MKRSNIGRVGDAGDVGVRRPPLVSRQSVAM